MSRRERGASVSAIIEFLSLLALARLGQPLFTPAEGGGVKLRPIERLGFNFENKAGFSGGLGKQG